MKRNRFYAWTNNGFHPAIVELTILAARLIDDDDERTEADHPVSLTPRSLSHSAVGSEDDTGVVG